MQSIRVWDIPVRLFHWLLVLSVAGLFITANLGGNWMEWHKKIGFLTLGLVTFRVVWGFVGSYHARFASFVRGPAVVIAYAKSSLKSRLESDTGIGTESNAKSNAKSAAESTNIYFLGHNPLGALSVIALLTSVAFQAITGLFANDDILLEGPYASTVSKAVSDQLSNLHKLNSDLLVVLIGLHLAVIIFYTFYKKEPLVKAMITGKKKLNASTEAENEAMLAGNTRPALLSWSLALFVAALTYVVVTRAFW